MYDKDLPMILADLSFRMSENGNDIERKTHAYKVVVFFHFNRINHNLQYCVDRYQEL